MAGWTHHGGAGGYARQEPFNGGVNYFTRMFTGTLSTDVTRRHNFLYVPLNAAALNFDSRVWDGAVDETFKVFMGDTELGTVDVTATDQTWRNQSLPIPQALRNTVTTIRFELVEGNGGGVFGDTAQVDIDSVAFGMANPQLQSSVAPGSVIDFGTIQGGAMKTLTNAFSLANVGQAGSLLDVFDLRFRNLGSAGGGIFDVTTFASPLTLAAGGPAAAQSIKFTSDNTRGAFQWDMAFSTTVGPVTYRLRGTVVPEPATIALLASVLVLATARVSRGGAYARRSMASR
jgi:hypothetical protein